MRMLTITMKEIWRLSLSRTDEVWFDTEDNYEYSGVVIKGIKKGSNQSEILNMLHEAGLPEPYGIENLK